MFDDLNDLYQQVIIDHSKSPRNFRRLEAATRTAQGHNPLCGDNIALYLEMDGDVIKDIGFQGFEAVTPEEIDCLTMLADEYISGHEAIDLAATSSLALDASAFVVAREEDD